LEVSVAKADVVVLGAGIIGTSIGVHLAKRGVSVAIIDRRGPGEGTSYGNTGIIEGNTIFPAAFPSDWGSLLRVALKRAPEANYHFSFLPKVAPWLLSFRAYSQPERLLETATVMRPLFARAVAEHEALSAEAGGERYLRRNGWLKLYRTDSGFAGTRRELELAATLGIPNVPLGSDAARELEPSLAPVFRHAVHWTGAVSVTNPLGLTRVYSSRFGALGGITLNGDARSLHRANGKWRVDTESGPLDAADVVVALGPWSMDLLKPLGIKLPFAVKRGYHRHFHSQGNAALSRPILDAENGYCLAPMEQGIRLTTGVEFRGLFPLGEAVESEPWMGSRPCLPDSRPVISRAPGQSGLWLAFGHAHWGLTLGPVTGRLIAEMITGATPFCDPAPYSPARFVN
jgi:D-amino-acid dehydrogenase